MSLKLKVWYFFLPQDRTHEWVVFSTSSAIHSSIKLPLNVFYIFFIYFLLINQEDADVSMETIKALHKTKNDLLFSVTAKFFSN